MTPIQDIEDALAGMNTLRMLATATGVNLDNLGQIIGLARTPGDSDDLYRQKLYAEIKLNTSEGQPEAVIQTYQLFTSATLVLLYEGNYAGVLLESEYIPPDQETADLLLRIVGQVLPAGVRAEGLVGFDATEAFAYAGTLSGLGYGSVGNPTQGGKYPHLFTRGGFFEYAGSDTKGQGYGSAIDPLVGGRYASV